ncbi:MAG TPA: hypothetical protein ENH96_03555 [Chlamydiae bacterium]|nr:hypothetical protein [Candidatus Anoxychlamydiales bacterium]HEU64447.1 hypothetical protein [Chlamydiota bacterium]
MLDSNIQPKRDSQRIEDLNRVIETQNKLAKLDGLQTYQKALPHDIEQTVSKASLFIADTFSKISAFFQIVKNYLLGQVDMSMNQIAMQKAYSRKLELYNDKKLNSEEKAYLALIGKKLSSLEDLDDLDDLKEIDPKVFKFFKAIASKKEVSRIQYRLKEIKETSPKNNYYLLLIAANKFAKAQGSSSEVREFLKRKLEKIAAKKVKEKFKKQNNLSMLSRAKDGLTKFQKIAIGAGLVALGAGSVAGYYYLTPAAVPAVWETATKGLEGIRQVGNRANGIGKISSDAAQQIPREIVSDASTTGYVMQGLNWLREVGNRANG